MVGTTFVIVTSVAETCRFKIDLRSGFVKALCSLAVSISHHETDDGAASNGRRVLEVLAGFRRRRPHRCRRRHTATVALTAVAIVANRRYRHSGLFAQTAAAVN